MAKREFLQLAHRWVPEKHGCAGSFMSIKLDGRRAFWDGGISRGLFADEVPWANVEKDYIKITRPKATGLWSRYGSVIHAPDWWLNKLPTMFLDGELYGGLQSFQSVASTVSKVAENCDSRAWKDVTFYAFGSPPPEVIFAPGEIDNKPHFVKTFDNSVLPWALKRHGGYIPKARDFRTVLKIMELKIEQNDVVRIHNQIQLPFNTEQAYELVQRSLEEEIERKGEGLILRKAHSLWLPERTHDLLKVKQRDDAEATVIGYTTGKLTDRGSKHLGRMGALICSYNGRRFELAGLNDEERPLSGVHNGLTAQEWATEHPGMDCPSWIESKTFPRNTTITFRYRELTRDGIPKEASYYRKA